MSIFNLDIEDEGARMDRSLCNIIDEMNQVKDRLRKTKQRRNEETRECKTLKKELNKFKSWANDQSRMISTLKRDKAKLTHKIHSTRTYILVLKHMLSSCESKRDELTKEFNSKNVSYRNKCSKAKSKKLSLENKIQRIKEIELKRHHLEDTMKTRQSKRDDRLAKTRAGLRRLELAKEEKSSDEVAGGSGVEKNVSVAHSTVETKWQELIKPYNNDVMEFLRMFESKKQDLASREQRLKELQESSNYESYDTDKIISSSSSASAENDDDDDDDGDGSDDVDDDKKESDTENVEEHGGELETEENKTMTIQQLLSDSYPSINWESFRQTNIISMKRNGSVVELKIKVI
eukprot:g4543.t1